MNIKIFKYAIDIKPELALPVGAEVLSVGMQGYGIYLWAKVDNDSEYLEKRRFHVFGTGQEIPEYLNLKFIGTCHGEGLVLHVFEEI